MVKTLICTQDWIRPKNDKEEMIHMEDKLDQLEQLEKGMFHIFNFILDHFYFLMSYFLEINLSCFLRFFFFFFWLLGSIIY